jgi:hypothetical protein
VRTEHRLQIRHLHNVFTGSAILSGLGHSQVVFPHDWNVVDRSVTGFMTITAANGDELHASVTGTAIFRPGRLVAISSATDVARIGMPPALPGWR